MTEKIGKSGAATVKRVDERIRLVIESAVESCHRCVFALIGDESKTPIMNLHYMLTKAHGKSDNHINVLWCMNKELAFGGMSRKRRMELNQKEKLGGRIITTTTHENFESFLTQTNIRYCFYKESDKITGHAYGMVILQDLDSLTPTVISRAIEATTGGGIVVFMIRALSSLQRLHSLLIADDSPQRESTQMNFRDRLLRSFAECPNFLCIDDGLTILPITNRISSLRDGILGKQEHEPKQKRDELRKVVTQLQSESLTRLCSIAMSYDQGMAQLTLAKAITEQRIRPNNLCSQAGKSIMLISGKGRGKSAVLGLSIAYALHEGLRRVFVLAPSLALSTTLFEFVLRGLRALGFTENKDFEKCFSPTKDSHLIHQIIFTGKKSLQKVEFVTQEEMGSLFAQSKLQAFFTSDLLVVDEAGAIPIELLRFSLQLAPLKFLSMTSFGIESTGISFQRDVFSVLRKSNTARDMEKDHVSPHMHSQHILNKIIYLSETVHYASHDPIEEWATKLLCMPSGVEFPSGEIEASASLQCKPHPDKCILKYVSKERIFSYSKLTEQYLRKIMLVLFHGQKLCHADILQTFLDSPLYHILVIVGPTSDKEIPDVLCVMFVRRIQDDDSLSQKYFEKEQLASILISQYDEPKLAKHAGMEILHIATHPDAHRCGYASRAISLLIKNIQGYQAKESDQLRAKDVLLSCSHTNILEGVQWLGVRFDAAPKLFQFWSCSNFKAIYLDPSQSTSGDHSIIMIRSAEIEANDSSETVDDIFARMQSEFSRRYLLLAQSLFRLFPLDISVALMMQLPPCNLSDKKKRICVRTELNVNDIRRLKAFAGRKSDLGRIRDLIPRLAKLYFWRILDEDAQSKNPSINALMITILMGMGIHGHSFDEMLSRKPFFGTSITLFQVKTLLTDAIDILTRALFPLVGIALCDD